MFFKISVLRISQYLQDDTCATFVTRLSLLALMAFRPVTLLKGVSNTGAFL